MIVYTNINMYVQYGAVDNVYLSDQVYKPSLNMAVFAFVTQSRVNVCMMLDDAGLEGGC